MTGAQWWEPRLTSLVRIATGMSVWYAVELVVDSMAPRVTEAAPQVGLFGSTMPGFLRVQFWAVLASWLVAIAVLYVGPVWRRRAADPVGQARRGVWLRIGTATVLLLPYTVLPLREILVNGPVLLLCLPTTAFGLWAVYRMQRYRQIPLWLVLSVFGWGALVATGFGGSTNVWLLDYAPRFATNTIEAGVGRGDPGVLLRVNHDITVALALNAGFFEELGKGLGVLLAYLLLRRYIDGPVSGVVIGAAIGLGFNLVESVEYASAAHGGVGYFQFFMRQSVGLLAAHTAFTAVIGAGFGVARQLADPVSRRIAIGCGFLLGMAGHFASDVIFPWFGQTESRWLHVTPWLDTIVLPPLLLIVVQGPVVAMYLLLVRRGLASQGAGIAAELRAEAALGLGTVTETESTVLLDPGRRFWLRITVLGRYGPAAYRSLARLQQAQLELATQRWHRSRDEVADDAVDEQSIRERILVLRRRTAAQVAPRRPAEVPA